MFAILVTVSFCKNQRRFTSEGGFHHSKINKKNLKTTYGNICFSDFFHVRIHLIKNKNSHDLKFLD